MTLQTVLITIYVATALNCLCILGCAWAIKKLIKIIKELSQ